MKEFPLDLLAALSTTAVEVAQHWWEGLGEADRRRIAELWDERLEISFFAPQADDDGNRDDWESLPVVEGGRFVPHDDRGLEEWGPGYFEHLLQNPELLLGYDPQQGAFFHICTHHSAAHACVKAGEVPSMFSCPVDDRRCPLLPLRGCRLVASGRL